MVLFMHKLPGGHVVPWLGLAILLASMFQWFTKIVNERLMLVITSLLCSCTSVMA